MGRLLQDLLGRVRNTAPFPTGRGAAGQKQYAGQHGGDGGGLGHEVGLRRRECFRVIDADYFAFASTFSICACIFSSFSTACPKNGTDAAYLAAMSGSSDWMLTLRAAIRV